MMELQLLATVAAVVALTLVPAAAIPAVTEELTAAMEQTLMSVADMSAA
jgi:hypothetical protein